jgi:hypothetical protein
MNKNRDCRKQNLALFLDLRSRDELMSVGEEIDRRSIPGLSRRAYRNGNAAGNAAVDAAVDAAVETRAARPPTWHSRCSECVVYVVGAFTLVFLLIWAREVYNDEDSNLNGSILGAPGQLRVQVYSNSPQGHAADGQIVIVSSLNGLLREASALFDVQIDRLYTQAGAKVSELSVPSSGRSCLYDGTRCVYDGSSLFAASEGAAFVARESGSDSE